MNPLQPLFQQVGSYASIHVWDGLISPFLRTLSFLLLLVCKAQETNFQGVWETPEGGG